MHTHFPDDHWSVAPSPDYSAGTQESILCAGLKSGRQHLVAWSQPNKEHMLYDRLSMLPAQFNRSIAHLTQIASCWRAEGPIIVSGHKYYY